MEKKWIFLASSFGVFACLIVSSSSPPTAISSNSSLAVHIRLSGISYLLRANLVHCGNKRNARLYWKTHKLQLDDPIVKCKVLYWPVHLNQSKHEMTGRRRETITVGNKNMAEAVIYGLDRFSSYILRIKICTRRGICATEHMAIPAESEGNRTREPEVFGTKPTEPVKMTTGSTTRLIDSVTQLVAGFEEKIDTDSEKESDSNIYHLIYGTGSAVIVMIPIFIITVLAVKYRRLLAHRTASEVGKDCQELPDFIVSLENAPSLDEKLVPLKTLSDGFSCAERSRIHGGLSDKPDSVLASCPTEVSEVSAETNPVRVSDVLCDILSDAVPELSVCKLIDHHGGVLKLRNTSVSLSIPPMALSNGRQEWISISLETQEHCLPTVAPDQWLLSPVVNCGPDGMKFDRPVHITMPHCAVMDHENGWEFEAKYSTNKRDEADGWCTIIPIDKETEDCDSQRFWIEDNLCHLDITHFTKFSSTGRPTDNDGIDLWILAYFTAPTVDTDCAVRVYGIPSTDAALETVRTKFEKPIDGRTSDTPKFIRFKCSGGNMKITLTGICEGWKPVNGTVKEIPYDNMKKVAACPNVAFTFTRSTKDVYQFRCIAEVQQIGREGQENGFNGNSVQVTVITMVERKMSSSSYRTSSGYASCPATPTVSNKNHFKIPLEKRKLLCMVLDQRDTFMNDWRMVAERLDCPLCYIRYWERGLGADVSPSEKLVEWWESCKSEEIPLSQLVQIIRDLDRDDAAELIAGLCQTEV